MKQDDFGERYSGKRSGKFWSRINDVKGKKGMALYGLGCALQNLESEILQMLAEHEAGRKK